MPGPLALQVLVTKKRARGRIPDRFRIPPFIEAQATGLPSRIHTDVRAVGRGRLHTLVSDVRPARPGFNVGGRRSGSGTLTCVVSDRGTGALLGLSCRHVLAPQATPAPGDSVLYPSFASAQEDNLLPLAPIGQLQTLAPLGPDALQNVDAATFAPGQSTDLDATIAVINVRPTATRDESRISVGLPVQKVGYASELTVGTVQAVALMVTFSYPQPGGGETEVMFADQIGITTFAEPGDSGALVFDENFAAVGMHFGSFDGMSVCTPMQRVLDAVQCDLA
jgi:hypothetical protein